jgi:hypothetical protein
MPLYDNGLDLVRANLEAIARGEKVRILAIGALTGAQLAAINASRATLPYPADPIIAEIKFLGRHISKSRITQDGYTVDDVLDQVASALADGAVLVKTQKATVLQNRVPRMDRYGSLVQDQAVLECTTRHPWPELFSVIPKNDRPPKARGR